MDDNPDAKMQTETSDAPAIASRRRHADVCGHARTLLRCTSSPHLDLDDPPENLRPRDAEEVAAPQPRRHTGHARGTLSTPVVQSDFSGPLGGNPFSRLPYTMISGESERLHSILLLSVPPHPLLSHPTPPSPPPDAPSPPDQSPQPTSTRPPHTHSPIRSLTRSRLLPQSPSPFPRLSILASACGSTSALLALFPKTLSPKTSCSPQLHTSGQDMALLQPPRYPL